MKRVFFHVLQVSCHDLLDSDAGTKYSAVVMKTTYLSFSQLCLMLQQIRETRGTSAKIAACASFLQQLQNPEEIRLATEFIGEGAFSSRSGHRAAAGGRTIGLAAAEFCGIDYDLVFKPSRTAVGSTSETVEKLLAATPEGRKRRSPRPTPLGQMRVHFHEIRTASTREEKIDVLQRVWRHMQPVESKYMIRMMGQGSLRIGFEGRSLIQAIAKAWNRDAEQVRYAHMVTGSMGETAVMAFEDRLDEAQFRLFHPLAFMLASPADLPEGVLGGVEALEDALPLELPFDLHDYVAEEKFDGMRCQLHTDGQEIRLFSRDQNDITVSFPDVCDEMQERVLPPMVLDGELVVFVEDRIQPFQMLQKRMGRKKPGARTLSTHPVRFIAYDLLYHDGQPCFHQRLAERRVMLESLGRRHRFMVSRQFSLGGDGSASTRIKRGRVGNLGHEVGRVDEESAGREGSVGHEETVGILKMLFQRALERGNEGLMLKKCDSVYEYGQRRRSWLKVKQPGGSLDTVMMYAHAGSGKRGGMFSDFTLGISVREDERYEEEFVPIGKAYGGYTDEELRMLNRRIKELTVERYGPTVGLRPGIVVELEFDGIQINPRTKAGYTLRFPRFRAIRWDLSPEDADTLADVERLVEGKLARKALVQREGGSLLRFDLAEDGEV